jgi:hypothetical protein
MSKEDSHEDYMARERVKQLPADAAELRSTFNRLPAEDRIPALGAVLRQLSDTERGLLLDKDMPAAFRSYFDQEIAGAWAELGGAGVVQTLDEPLCDAIRRFVDEIRRGEAVMLRDTEASRRERTRIREAYQAAWRANMNLLASMHQEERIAAIGIHVNALGGAFVDYRPDDYAKQKARALVVETYGADAVEAALGDVK